MNDLFGLYENCRLCPRKCGAERLSGKPGLCGMSYKLRLARAALHFWEEPCISGEEGSGTVFFSGCSLGCLYCQNSVISQGFGKDVPAERLSEIFIELQRSGANNINLVTPTHYVPHIVKAVNEARPSGLTVPVVYNTSGYENPETLELLKGTVDVFLTDYKYISTADAALLSGAADYPYVASEALRIMHGITGAPEYDERGIMRKGTIVRHLVLPERGNEAKKIIRFVYENYGDELVLSIMNQYTPAADDVPEWLKSPVSDEEYSDVVAYAESIGVTEAFIQEGGTVSESFIPPFDLTGV